MYFIYIWINMTTREKFKRRVIELIHWLPYEEAVTMEKKIEDWEHRRWEVYPITIWRLIQALINKKTDIPLPKEDNIIYKWLYTVWYIVNMRKLADADGTECTDNDQTDETIEKLYNLIK